MKEIKEIGITKGWKVHKNPKKGQFKRERFKKRKKKEGNKNAIKGKTKEKWWDNYTYSSSNFNLLILMHMLLKIIFSINPFEKTWIVVYYKINKIKTEEQKLRIISVY